MAEVCYRLFFSYFLYKTPAHFILSQHFFTFSQQIMLRKQVVMADRFFNGVVRSIAVISILAYVLSWDCYFEHF